MGMTDVKAASNRNCCSGSWTQWGSWEISHSPFLAYLCLPYRDQKYPWFRRLGATFKSFSVASGSSCNTNSQIHKVTFKQNLPDMLNPFREGKTKTNQNHHNPHQNHRQTMGRRSSKSLSASLQCTLPQPVTDTNSSASIGSFLSNFAGTCRLTAWICPWS